MCGESYFETRRQNDQITVVLHEARLNRGDASLVSPLLVPTEMSELFPFSAERKDRGVRRTPRLGGTASGLLRSTAREKIGEDSRDAGASRFHLIHL